MCRQENYKLFTYSDNGNVLALSIWFVVQIHFNLGTFDANQSLLILLHGTDVLDSVEKEEGIFGF